MSFSLTGVADSQAHVRQKSKHGAWHDHVEDIEASCIADTRRTWCKFADEKDEKTDNDKTTCKQ